MTSEGVKALIYVIALAIPAFYVGGRIADSVVTPREFSVWRAVWFVVTVAAFLFQDYLIFAATMTLVCLYAHSVRVATVMLFIIMLLAAPLVNVTLGGLGVINQLLELNNGRLLSIVLLIPVLATHRTPKKPVGACDLADTLIVCYVLLAVTLDIRQWGIISSLRDAFMHALDVLVPYFAFSRTIGNISDLRKVLLAFVIAALPLALIGIFETTRAWLLYAHIITNWGGLAIYSGRGSMLRAYASIYGGPIIFGIVIMIAIGFTFALPRTQRARRFTGIARAILGVGLFSSLSRGPLFGTAILIFTFLATGTSASAKLAKLALVGAAMLVVLVVVTPGGEVFLSFLPFSGSDASGSVSYRRQLIENSLRVIERNLWLGSPDYMSTPEMQEMIQGQQIIDIVNTYLGIALSYGLIGLGLFMAFFATVLNGLRRLLKFGFLWDKDSKTDVRVSLATLIAILVTIGTVSYIDVLPYICWSFAGLCVALIRIAYKERATAALAFQVSPARV